MACLEALALAKDYGIRRIAMVSYCVYVMILKVKDILERTISFGYVCFTHKGRVKRSRFPRREIPRFEL